MYDVREKLSQTAVPLGTAEIALGVIQDTTRLRIPLRSTSAAPGSSTAASATGGAVGNSGFITLTTWTPELPDHRRMQRSPAKCGDAALSMVTTTTTTVAAAALQQQKEQAEAAMMGGEQQPGRGHRRSQSLPPKLGVKLFVPAHHRLALYFANPNVSI